MSKIALVTDSASDIPTELEKQYGIDIMPFLITVDGKSYTEREDFTNEEYYDMLAHCETIPKTSQITMMRFEEKFAEYAQKGFDELIYVAINSEGSNTYNAACMAKQSFKDENPDSKMNIYIVDSHSYSMTYGWAVCEAARKIAAGADAKSIVEYLNDHFARVEVALSMYTLKFVKKSGRVSAAAAFAGELLGLRPIITIIDGVTATASKVRGDVNVMPSLITHVKKRIADGSGYLVASTNVENGKMLAKLCKKEFGKEPDCVFLLGAAVATNTGPDAVAIIFEGAARR